MCVVAIGLVALLGVLAAPAARSGGGRQTTLATLDSRVLVQLNEIRSQHGLQPLRLNPRLHAAAAQHSREMGIAGYFAHDSHDGTAFWKRISRRYGPMRHGYWVGENLLWAAPDLDAPKALDLWMHSPEHRANILNPRWREIGISARHFVSAPGTYEGREVTIITTDFAGRPA
jgi:uncharacterized protein YkwD